jgi:hypothetical protein
VSLQAAVQHEAYDRKLLLEKTKHLNLQGSSAPNVREIMMGLRVDLIRNIANIAKRWVGKYVWQRLQCMRVMALVQHSPAILFE